MEEYGENYGFVRPTTPPEKANRGSSPKKARYTGASIASLRENKRSGKLVRKIKKYDEEYARLAALATRVDLERQEGLEFADVQKSIKAYNAQAKRLAAIGVEVLVLNQDIQKITFTKETQAKAIKVPGFLIGPLRLLTAAGRNKAKLEREAREEKEQAIFNSIVSTAEEAIGQVKESQIDADKFDSLQKGNVVNTVKADLGVEEPTTDVPVGSPVIEESDEKPAEAQPVEKTAEEIAQEQADKKKAEEAGAEAVAKRNQAINDALKKAYKKQPDPKKKREAEAAVRKAVASDDYFAILANTNESLHIALVKGKTGNAKMLGTFINGERKIVTPSMFGVMAGLEDKNEISTNYLNMVALCEFANLWKKNASYEVHESEDMVRSVDAFDADNKKLFDFVISSVRDGLTVEEINAKAASEFNEVEAKAISNVVASYDVVKTGVDAFDAMMGTSEKKVEEPVVEGTLDAAQKVAIIDNVVAGIARGKYGVKKDAVDEPVTDAVAEEVEAKPVVDEENVPPIVKDEQVVSESVPENKPVVGGYVSQIGTLVDEISNLTARRDQLKELLGDKAGKALEGLETAINDKLAQISELALGGVVNLGNDKASKDVVAEEQVEEEIHQPEVEEAVVVPKAVEETPAEDTYIYGDNRYDYDRGMMSDKDKDEAIAWWSMMAPTLDNPDFQEAQRLRIASREVERAAERADIAVEQAAFDANKHRRIEEERERVREREARLQLKHCKEFEDLDIDSFIAENGQNVAEADRFTTPYGLVQYMQKYAPNMYADMMNGYNQSMAEKQAAMIENGHVFSDESVERFNKR